MALPGVKITLDNGAIGGVPASADGISGLILTGATVSGAGKVKISTAYRLDSLEAAVALGIVKTGSNAFAYRHIKGFYDAAGTGSELWIMIVASSATMESMMDKTGVYAPALLDAAKGKIRKLGIAKEAASTSSGNDAISVDVNKALVKGQVLADEYAAKFKPFRFLVDGREFNGTVSGLPDMRASAFNRGGVLLASTTASSKNSEIGFAIGYMAKLPVQRKISRVKNGPLPITAAYFTHGKTTESLENSWNAIHDKGYIFFRTFAGKAGYFFSDDPTATAITDDYAYFSRGFVIDKALVIAYQVYVNEIGDEIATDASGKLPPAVVKNLQGKVENAISLQMLSNAEASSVQAIIDHTQDVVTTGKLKITLRVRPVGYANFIDILLGFSKADKK